MKKQVAVLAHFIKMKHERKNNNLFTILATGGLTKKKKKKHQKTNKQTNKHIFLPLIFLDLDIFNFILLNSTKSISKKTMSCSKPLTNVINIDIKAIKHRS